MPDGNQIKKKMGRPANKIDLAVVEKLGQLQCTYAECAAFLNIKEQTLKKRKDFLLSFKKGFESGKISLRRTQFKLAENNATMAIWLGKQYLGQRDQGLAPTDIDTEVEIDWVDLE